MAAPYSQTEVVEAGATEKRDELSVEAISHVEDGMPAIVTHGPVDAEGKPLPFHNGRPLVNPEDERAMKRLRLKLDLWILPLLTILMLLSSMDKSDVSLLLLQSLIDTNTRY